MPQMDFLNPHLGVSFSRMQSQHQGSAGRWGNPGLPTASSLSGTIPSTQQVLINLEKEMATHSSILA